MMRCPAASDLWQPTRKELTALPLEVHEKITDFVWKSTKSQLRLPRRSVRRSRAMPPLEVRGRRNSVSSIPTRPAAQFQTPRTMPREIAPNAVQTQIRAQWPRELPRKVADATGSGHWNSKVGQYFFRRHAPGPLQKPCARPCKFIRHARWPLESMRKAVQVQTPRAVARIPA